MLMFDLGARFRAATLHSWEAQLMLAGYSEIGDPFRIGRGERSCALGLWRIDPDPVDLLLGLLTFKDSGMSHREVEPAGMTVTVPGRAVPNTTDFPVRRSNRSDPEGKVMRTWSAMGVTTSCSASCFQ
jgi:hypothetical protein